MPSLVYFSLEYNIANQLILFNFLHSIMLSLCSSLNLKIISTILMY